MEHGQHTPTREAPKPYNLKPPKLHQHVAKPQKKETHKARKVAQLGNNQPQQNQTRIKRSSAAQAPPRIHMAFPSPCSMPHRNHPTSSLLYKQTTIDQYMNRK